jgi:prevent-host-death family protein
MGAHEDTLIYDESILLTIRTVNSERGMTPRHRIEKPLDLPRSVAPVLQSLMARQITQRELRNQSGEIMRALDRGEEFIVTRNGVPVGELVPVRRRQYVPTVTLIAALRNSQPVDFKQFRKDVDTLLDPIFEPRV